MRIGVLSDTHIPDRAKDVPKKILDEFKSVDIVLHAGDLVDVVVLEQLRSVCKNVKAVWGNMDPHEIRGKLSEKEVFTAGRFKIGLTHGFGPPAGIIDRMAELFKADNVDIVVFGHSHTATNEKKGGVLYFNPGSATDDIFAPFKSYGVIELGDSISAKIIKL